MEYQKKYIKYKKKYHSLKKIRQEIPIKYIEFNNGEIITKNTMDDDLLNSDSEFLIGSITKIFISLLILHLHQDNLLSVTDPIDMYIKSNKLNNFSNIIIWDLLNHTSGIKHHVNFVDFDFDKFQKNNMSAKYIVNSIIKENIISPNKIYLYSNAGYYILGAIIEIVCNKIWWKTIHVYCDNLEHTDIGFPSNKLYDQDKNINPKINYTIAAISAGGMYSSINDISKYITYVINNFNENTLKLLKNMYYISYDYEKNIYILSHDGNVPGGKSIVEFIFDANWNIQKKYIKLETIIN